VSIRQSCVLVRAVMDEVTTSGRFLFGGKKTALSVVTSRSDCATLQRLRGHRDDDGSPLTQRVLLNGTLTLNGSRGRLIFRARARARARVCVCVCVCVCVSPSLSLSHSVSIFSPVAHSHINKSIRVFHRIIFLRDRFHLHDMRCRTNCNMESTIEIVVFNRRKLTNQSNMRRIIDYDWSIFYNLSLFTVCSLFSVSYFVTFCFFLIFSVLLTIVFLAIFFVSFEIR